MKRELRPIWIAWLIAVHVIAAVNTIAHWDCWHNGKCNRMPPEMGSR